MNNSRSITINETEYEIRGLYWGELDESSRASMQDAIALMGDIDVSMLDGLMERQEKQSAGDVKVSQPFGGLHQGTLLKCGVLSIDGDEVGVEEGVKRLSPKAAKELAQAIYDLTDLPDTDGNLAAE
jgi:hypothetical protein